MATLEVANTIRNQIGSKTLFMLGAQNLVGGENYFLFKIRGSKKVSHIKITLNGKDLYDMEFSKVWGTKIKHVNTVNDVYCDQLHEIIEENTGLYTKLF